MGPKISLILPTTWYERLIAVIGAPFVGLLGLACFFATHRVFGHGAADWRSRMFETSLTIAFGELSLSIAFFALLVFLWAAFRVTLAERALLFFAAHLWHAMLLFLAAFLICIAVAYTV